MERTTPRSAADALADVVRSALQCVAAVEVLTTGAELGITSSLVLVPHGANSKNHLLLRGPDRSPYLQLEVSIEYAVIFAPGTSDRKPFRSIITRYIYGIADLSDRELFSFHWHPVGVSDVRTPHLHVSAAQPVSLPVRPSIDEADVLDLGRLHFPTHQVEIAELVRFLITELGVGPRKEDWESVLDRVDLYPA